MWPMASTARAQDRVALADFAAGALVFPDDTTVTEGFTGASVRLYLSPRISVGPEVAYAIAEDHGHLFLTGNFTLDFNRRQRATPFLTFGAGLARTAGGAGVRRRASNDPTFTAGGGVRGRLGRRVEAGAEARIASSHPRFSYLRFNAFVSVGLR
jgi:hypothetical protein